MSVEANVSQRKAAEAAAATAIEFTNDVIKELIREHTIEALNPFFSEFRRCYGKNLLVLAPAPANQIQPMNEAQARAFGQKPMPDKFRKFAGQQVRDVPEWYLDFICEPDEFVEELRRWRRSTVNCGRDNEQDEERGDGE